MADTTVETNVVYGMYSGLALLMGLHYPANPNGYGLVVILGSGWHAPPGLDAAALKDNEDIRRILPSHALLASGYTLFSINHRAAPVFQYPAAVEDAQRAVRFVRHYAARYEIDPDRLGAIGHSSGGHLASMLGVLDGVGTLEDPDPVNQENSKVQAVVALSAPEDLTDFATRHGGSTAALSSFLGADITRNEFSKYAAASPTTHVSNDDPPFLLIHGEADPTVPFSQSELFRQVLTQADVAVELIRVPSGDHILVDPTGTNASDYFGAIVGWFDRHLRNRP